MRAIVPDTKILGTVKIEDVEISVDCRDGVPKILRGLQELYNSEYFDEVMAILEKKIKGDKKETGRRGMSIWEIFVLAVVRHGDDLDFDKLHHNANNDKMLRGIMGVDNEAGFTRIKYHYDTIKGNLNLLDEKTLNEINEIIVKMGHDVFNKKNDEPLDLKTDSYVCESNVHFPTDYNLLWDSARKCIDIIAWFVEKKDLAGWRKFQNWYNSIKNKCRQIGQVSSGGGKNKEIRMQEVVKEFLILSKNLISKIKETDFPVLDVVSGIKFQEFKYYMEMLELHVDLLERRVIKGETIPHEEKKFSIFEPYTEWINKGKKRPTVELGKKVLITSDQYHLILDGIVLDRQSDVESVEPLAERVLKKHEVAKWSFDKGFWSKENYELLSEKIDTAVMPKKGKTNQEEYEREHDVEFKQSRKKHSAIESNINELECKGLGRCRDKGYEHYKRYIALGIIGYNLHRIGAKKQEIENEKLKQEKKNRVA